MRFFLFVFTILFPIVATPINEGIIIYGKSEVLCSLPLDKNICLTFEQDQIKIASNKNEFYFPLDAISKYCFTQNSFVDLIVSPSSLTLNNNILSIPSPIASTQFQIYTPQGSLIFVKTMDSSPFQINLNHFTSNILIVKYCGLTFKIHKK
jgi:hypothetical protein